VKDVNVDPNYKFDPTLETGIAMDFPDTDGWSNLKEYEIGTDPTNRTRTTTAGWTMSTRSR